MTIDEPGNKFTGRLPDPLAGFGDITDDQRLAVQVDLERWRLANDMASKQDDESIRRYLRGLSDDQELKQDMNRRFIAIRQRKQQAERR